ncbi:salicylate synthase [Streptomyces sp. NPDC051776]|uniref:salicylate synthase n=1 Tax=Streptomyces sp. NPDC051776 TaxID=3155414 RepID=UPI0034347938
MTISTLPKASLKWARAVPAFSEHTMLEAPADPAAAAVHLAAAIPGEEHAVYEREGTWHFAAGTAATVTVSPRQATCRAAGGIWTLPTHGRPVDRVAEALAALGHEAGESRRVYGWAAFELAHVLHTTLRQTADEEPLIHLLVPRVDVALTPGRAQVQAVDGSWTAMIADALTAMPDTAAAPAPRPLPGAEDIIASGRIAYRRAVARTIEDIGAGKISKAVVSRAVPLPDGSQTDLGASYYAGRQANNPARSFLFDLGGWQAAGFSPETVVEVDEDGRVVTQPLAGTRALGQDADENRRLRAELLEDSKEVHEHAISVRLACEELSTVCRPGSVAVDEFMTIKERGSVQHLASRVVGRLGDEHGPWSAFATLFPAITATGAPKAAALSALARHEPGTRGLYGGAVFTADVRGSLDAALVLRSILRRHGRTWLRAGAGVMGSSDPDREYEETCEKLRSVAPHLRQIPGQQKHSTQS